MSGFVRFSCPIDYAVFSEYPARIAALVAFKSIKYSSQNLICFTPQSYNLFANTVDPSYIWLKILAKWDIRE